ncbi:MAG: aspartate--tRNA ligase [Armatimonadetes bacterium]|nr:aspartate--tRNA ligase [Armatimonadota bacterium]
MMEPLSGLRRTHSCGELTLEQVGREVTLMGWVHRRRDLGGLIFIDLRDRVGITQVVFNPQTDPVLHKKAGLLRGEFVVAVTGTVHKRPPGTENPQIGTGQVDVIARELRILNTAKPLPLQVSEDQEVDEALRMKYRYLDLRRAGMQSIMHLRHRVTQSVRKFFDQEGFWEVETPLLIKSTPEGARDYLVPSRTNPGRFFALPQSPQIFKQLLMVAGFERYFQIARCLRDEDLRADRQPEFTQIDVEMSFVEQEDVLTLMERLFASVFQECLDYTLPIPFPRLTYKEAMEKYGNDKPELRFGLPILDVSDGVRESEFSVFSDTLAKGGSVKGISLPGKGGLSRKDLDGLGKLAESMGAKGLLSYALTDEGPKSSILKYLSPSSQQKLQELAALKPGDLLLMIADETSRALDCLGKLRVELGRRFDLIPRGKFAFAWIVDFPLFHYNEDTRQLEPQHHPFTSPLQGDLDLLDKDPTRVRAAAYDLVLNGYEVGSGSIRIHQRPLQEKIFNLIGLSMEEAKEKFGFLMEAFEYGAPPHGGIAPGLDRIVMIMAGAETIREVIAFPKNQNANCLLTGAPVEVSEDQLKLLRIRVDQG